MEYVFWYFLLGLISYLGLVGREIWRLWPIEKRSIAKPKFLIKQAVIIILFWPWLVPFAIYEELK